MVNEAEGEAQRIIRAAEAKAAAIGKIAEALDRDESAKRAMEFEVAQKYFSSLEQMGKSPSTVFLPTNLGDVSGIVAQGVGAFRALSQNFQPPAKIDSGDGRGSGNT